MAKEVAVNEDLGTSGANSSVVGAMTAGGRSVVYQITSFYLRTPVKLFRPARFDYLHYLRVLLVGEDERGTHAKKDGRIKAPKFWNPRYFQYWENSSIGLLTKGLNKYGWRVIPERVLPPLVANSAAGVVLYTTYLTTLNYFAQDNESESGYHNPLHVLRAGFIAGAAQALASAPIDALYTRSSVDQLLLHAKTYDNLWVYAYRKLGEIGIFGCFGGFGLSLAKECLGFAAYFATFEAIKGQVCQWTINSIKHYRELKYNISRSRVGKLFQEEEQEDLDHCTPVFMTIKEEKWFHRFFVFVGGVSAALLLQIIQYPFGKLQKIHLSRLEVFDIYNRASINGLHAHKLPHDAKPIVKSPYLGFTKWRPFNIYYHSYVDTFRHVQFIHKSTGATCRWLYKGFLRNTLAIIPGTTAGLLLLEAMRNKLSESENSPQFFLPG